MIFDVIATFQDGGHDAISQKKPKGCIISGQNFAGMFST